MHRPRPSTVLLALAFALVFGSPCTPATAQDRPRGADADQRAEKIASDLRSLRKSPLRRNAARALALTQALLSYRDAAADAGLREILADSDDRVVIEQIVVATLIDPEHRLMRAVLNRLVQERGSEFDRRFDDHIRRRSDARTVALLASFAETAANRRTLRVEATRMLGRTRKPQALDPLVRLWGAPDPELRRVAKEAFQQVLPAGYQTRAEAVAALDSMRERGLTSWDLLNEELERRLTPPPAALGDVGREYVDLALEVVDRVGLGTLIARYLTSSAPAVRSAGATRLASYAFDEIEDGREREQARLRTGVACLTALQDERDETAREALLAPLAVLAPALRDRPSSVTPAALAAIVDCVDLEGAGSRSLRRSAIALLGKLRRTEAIVPLERTYDRLEDADWELRADLLTALDQIAERSLVGWLIERLKQERNDEISGRIIALLGKSLDSATVAPLRWVLANHASDRVRVRAVLALGKLWRGREFPAAAVALLDAGLIDADAKVRESAALSLGHAGPTGTGRERAVARLSGTAATDAEAFVRRAAAQSILELDDRGAVRHLAAAFSDPEVWELYLERVRQDAKNSGEADRALADADFLLSEESRRDQALEMLAAVATAREGTQESATLWKQGPDEFVRGTVRQRLAELLVEHGRPAEAVRWLTELIDAPERDQDPRAAWLISLARALLRVGGPEALTRGRAVIAEARRTPDLRPELRAKSLIELALNLIASGNPLAALKMLEPDPARSRDDAAVLQAPPGDLAAMLDEVRGMAERGRDAQRREVEALVARAFADPAEAAAREQLRALGAVAAFHVEGMLSAAPDLSSAIRLLAAAGFLTGKPFPVDTKLETSLASLAPKIQEARQALTAMANRL